MIKQYFTELERYKKHYGEKVILLWQCGSFFEVYALKNIKTGLLFKSNIESFGSICDYAVKDKKTSSTSGKKSQRYDDRHVVMMAGLPVFGAVESKISKLNDNGFTVALWKQDEEIKDIRKEYGVFSPGTKFQDNDNLSNNIMCISVEIFPKTLLHKSPRISCGLSIIDIISGETKFYEYHSEYFNESINYDEIERFNSIYNPSEIIIIHNFQSDDKLKNMVEFSSIQCEMKHIINTNEDSVHINEIKNCKKQTYQIEIFQKFYNNIDSDFFYANFAQYPYGTESLTFLLNFVYQHQKNLVKNIKLPEYDNNPHTMVLANHSLKQLNIIGGKRKHSSVLRFLNNCSTAMGKRGFSHQLLHPSCDEIYLNKEYNIISHCIKRKDPYFGIKEHLKKIGDMDKFYRKIILEKVTPSNIYKFHQDLNTINEIWDVIKHDEIFMSYLSDKIGNVDIKKISNILIKDIQKTLDLEKSSQIDAIPTENIFNPGIYEFVDTAVKSYSDSEIMLNKIIDFFNKVLSKREKKNKCGVKKNVKEKAPPCIQTTSRRAGLLFEQLDSCYESLEYATKINLEIKSLKYEKSTQNNVKIYSKQTNEICEKVFKGMELIKKEVKISYNDYMEKMLLWVDNIETLSKFVKLVDIVLTKSKLAVDNKYCKPLIEENEKSFFKAKKMRHLLIEHIQQNEGYVPNDISLGKEEDGMLLFGTNAVGKSSLIKSIGICTIMAQAGMYVPCSEFIYKPYKSLYTRILGNDDIFKGLSSFAVEMSELKSILKGDENSLILGDELCNGTEINSALRIFVAGLMMLNKNNCSHIFATHFHEITKMNEIVNLKTLVMKHMEVIFDREKGSLIYDRKLKDGPGTNNYGLLVCKSLGLPAEFIKIAENIELDVKLLNENLLKNKSSSYNSKKVKGKCELCGNPGVDIHHMLPQKWANESIIETNDRVIHKNHKSNLMNICKECHVKVTNEETVYERKKTNNGYEIFKK